MNLNGLAWMAGNWRCEIWGGVFEEYWVAPVAGAMIGMGRHLVGSETRFMEFLSIEADGDAVAMWILLGRASVGPKTSKRFGLVSSSESEVVFENLENDYPSRIVYSRTCVDRMVCRLTGSGDRVDVFDFARI